jgi:hypothetical protein
MQCTFYLARQAFILILILIEVTMSSQTQKLSACLNFLRGLKIRRLKSYANQKKFNRETNY